MGESFSYETLGPLSSTTNFDETEIGNNYDVFRTKVSVDASSYVEIPAADFFSLYTDENPEFETTPSPAASIKIVELPKELACFRAESRFKSPMLKLHKEILDFCDFISPTAEEEALRSAAVQRVFDVIKYIWPHAKVEVFGSFKSGLYLPTSDIDVVILDSKVSTPQIGLQALAKALSKKGIAKKMQVIAKARVPIAKFVEKKSDIAFDISFDVHNGPKAAEFIRDAINKLPPLKPLCLILKIFLQQRELNEVYSGGIGSYALLTMIMAHLQMYWRIQDSLGNRNFLENNLGILLIDFFDFYGRKLNIWDVGISCNARGTFFLKSNKGFLNSNRPCLLSIEDPQAPENDIGKNSFNFFQVRSAFSMAYSLLTDAKAIMNLGSKRSILGTIIRPDPLLLERKGGCNGTVTFKSILPDASEQPSRQSHIEPDILCNWHLGYNDDDEPLQREKVSEENAFPSSYKKSKHDKNGESETKKKKKAKRHSENKEEKESVSKKKKRWNDWQDRKPRRLDGSPWSRNQ